jgi:chromosome segregation ATPase
MPLSEAVIIAAVAAIPGFLLAIVALRKQPAESRSADAAADRAQHDASQSIAMGAKSLAEALCTEVANLQIELEKTKSSLKNYVEQLDSSTRLVESLRQRLSEAEARIEKSEDKATTAGKRAVEFREELIKVGTMLDQSRREHQRQIDEVALVIQVLLGQIEKLGGQPEIDQDTLKRIAILGQQQ